MIKNIVFDFGGVVLSEDDNWLHSNEVKKLLGADDEQLDNGWDSAWPDARSGKIGEDQFFRLFLLNSIGRHDDAQISDLKSIYRQMIEKLECFSLLPILKNKYRLLALTNVVKEWLDIKTRMFSLSSYFDLIISSCNEGVGKPSREIFDALVQKGKIVPAETVFVDNMEKNIMPAEKMGFKAILFTDKDSLVKEMGYLGIEI